MKILDGPARESGTIASLGAEVVDGDLRDFRSVAAAMSDIRRAYFTYPVQEGLLEAAGTFAAAARSAGVEQVVNMSQWLQPGDEQPTPHQARHWPAGQISDWADIGAVHLDATVFCENLRTWALLSLARDGVIALPWGREATAIPMVADQDVARVAAAVLTGPLPASGTVVRLIAGAATDNEITDAFAEVLDRPVQYVEITDDEWASAAWYAKSFGQSWALNWGAGLSAPFTEEAAKGSGLLLLIALAHRQVRTAFDGLILGAFIGLGFQIIEDIAYAMTSASSQFGANQIGASVGTIIVRMVSGVAAHILYSAIFCAGLIYLLGRPAEPRRVGRGLLLMAIPILLHGVWDSVAATAGGSVLTLVGLLIAVVVIALAIVVRVYELTVRRERDFMRDVMTPEQARNVITTAELDALAGNRKACKRYRKASPNRRERKRARYVLNAAYDLADGLAGARGADTDRVRFARAEVSRIRAGVPSPW